MKLDVLVQGMDNILNITGVHERNISVMEKIFDTKIALRGDEVYVDTDSLEVIGRLNNILSKMIFLSQKGVKFQERDVVYLIKMEEENKLDLVDELYLTKNPIITNFQGKAILPKTFQQKEYIKALEKRDLVFGIGPAGTGKTYLAVVYAVRELKNGNVKKIILTRPAVEAGESLGFLPGDLKDKIDPYLTPLYDALYDVLGVESTKNLIEKGIIEIAPLAYMRGRTLDNSYVILDEAQNTTINQMKMFLTRLGFQSKMVVTGDVTQIDLPKGVSSGLKRAIELLSSIKEISVIEFDRMDVVRHPLVAKILKCYDRMEN